MSLGPPPFPPCPHPNPAPFCYVLLWIAIHTFMNHVICAFMNHVICAFMSHVICTFMNHVICAITNDDIPLPAPSPFDNYALLWILRHSPGIQVGPVSPYDAEARALSHPVKKNIYMPRKMYPVDSYSGGPTRWDTHACLRGNHRLVVL